MSELFLIGLQFLLIAVILHYLSFDSVVITTDDDSSLTPFQFVYKVFDGDLDKVNIWFSTGNPHFGGLSPDAIVYLKGSKPICSFLMLCR